MSLTDFSFRHRVFVIFCYAMLIAYGAYCYYTIQVREEPKVPLKYALIAIDGQGMQADQLRQWVAKPIEHALMALSTVSRVDVAIRAGGVTVYVKGEYGAIKSVDSWLQQLRQRLDTVQLIPGVGQPRIIHYKVFDESFATLMLNYPETENSDQVIDLTEQLRDRIYSALPDIGLVRDYGRPKKVIYVELQSAKMASYHLTIDQLKQKLLHSHVINKGAYLRTESKNILILPDTELSQVSAVSNLRITLPGTKQVVPLSEIAHVVEQLAQPTDEAVYYNGKPAILLALYAKDHAHLSSLGKLVKQWVHDQSINFPKGYQLSIDHFQPKVIDASYEKFNENLLMSVLIVSVLVMLMLTWRSGLLVALMIPVSIFISCIFLQMTGLSLQRTVFGAMIVGMGLLIDNGMVIVEETRHLMDQGIDRAKAARRAANKYSIPLLISQLTTILAFMPGLLANSLVGDYMIGLPITMTVLLLVSWFVSQMLLPLICSKVLKVRPAHEQQSEEVLLNSMWHRMLRSLLTAALNNRLLVLLAVVAVSYSSIWAFSQLSRGFMPMSPSPQLAVSLSMPEASNVAVVVDEIVPFSRWLRAQSWVQSVSTLVGIEGPRISLAYQLTSRVNKPVLLVTLKHWQEADVLSAEAAMKGYLLKHLSHIEYAFDRVSGSPNKRGNINYTILGDDSEALYEDANRLRSILTALPGTTSASISWGIPQPYVSVTINRHLAEQLGISMSAIQSTLNQGISGAVLTEIYQPKTRVPVLFRWKQHERLDVEQAKRLVVYSPVERRGVHLEEIAKIGLSYRFEQMGSYNGQTSIRVTIQNRTMPLGDLSGYVTKQLQQHPLHPGNRLIGGGELAVQSDSIGAILKGAVPCGIIMLVVLVWGLASVRKLLILLAVLPLAFIGAIWGLFVTGLPFDYMALLGVLALMGIALNDGIILVEAIDEGLMRGMSIRQSIVWGARTRLRPIILTTVTTIFGMLPLLFNGGAFWRTLSVVVIAGELLSTLILLIVIPVFYSLLFRYWRPVNEIPKRPAPFAIDRDHSPQ